MKILYILNIAARVNNFSYTSMLAAQRLGWEYHIAGNWSYESDDERHADEVKYGIHIHQIDFIRQPYHPGNIKAYRQLLEVMRRENFDIMHCNTPIGGVLGRMAAKKLGVPYVIYQVHGFYFYKGAPLLYKILYYPVERIFAHRTDMLITINTEDTEAAKKFRLRGHGRVYFVPGVGIDISLFSGDVDRAAVREKLGISVDNTVLFSAGDLNKNKNNAIVLEALGHLQNENIQYIICGKGEMETPLREKAKALGLEKRVHFLGYRTDIAELIKASDVFVMPSLREGLPRSIMEAMASGLPCIVSEIRGNVDLVEENKGGFLCKPEDADAFAAAISKLAGDSALCERMSAFNLERIKEYDVGRVSDELERLYRIASDGVEK